MHARVHQAVRGKRLNRLLQLIALLRGPTSWNARRLAEHFQTSRRNVYRDLAVLELAGVPYYFDPDFGDGGGYRIRPEWWFPSVGLTQQECLDLAVLVRIAETGNIPLLDQVSEARDKLLGTLPAKQQDIIRTASELFDIFRIGLAEHGHSRSIMLCLQQALIQRIQIKGSYRSHGKKRAASVSLQPRRIFLCGNAWYLAAHCNKAKDTKLYRIARFTQAELVDRRATVDHRFSLREYLGNAWTVHRGDRDWYVEIIFTAEAAPLVSETCWHHTQELELQSDGSLIFRATVSGLEEIQYWVLGWGPRARVKKPNELRAQVQSLCASTMSSYHD